MKRGSSKEVIEANIKELIEAGHKPDQAKAIAEKNARQTSDYDSTGQSRYYTVSKLGPKRSLTPEGYLLCLDVPVARTGEMLYGEGEIADDQGEMVKGDQDGIIRVTRGPDDLFRPETIASFEGKSVTLGHPDEFVTPENVKQHEIGTMLNVRRGDGVNDDVMLADLLIKDKTAIKAIQTDGIEEVSNGYEADYEQQQPGRAVQHNIVGNHVALVERGRCGPRCAIGDEIMPSLKKKTWKDRFMAAFKANDAAELEKLASEVKDEEEESEEDKEKREREEKDKKTTDALSQVLDRLKAIDERLDKMESEDDDEDDDDDMDGEPTNDIVLTAEKTEKLDTAGVKLYTGDSAKKIPQLAEIIAPGFKIPTFDAKTTDAQRAATLCQCQRRALAKAYATDAGRAIIDPLLGGQKANFQKLPYALVNAAFHGTAAAMRVRNNDGGHRQIAPTRDAGKTVSIADINRANREFYKH
ncbi:DUF2213 domain-containing protein [Dyella mobilis]|uniref:DUF2213 domain-containing protein n=1 Tax=Dyella mobilis TaxID=1849582 RepID=UPI00195BE907|nr:DUF2213 domain-containing protein [Dyella mobilis]